MSGEPSICEMIDDIIMFVGGTIAPVNEEKKSGEGDSPLDLASVEHELPMLDRYYITTAINYTNGKPHVGHAYEGVTSDAIARWHRIAGREVYFLTGSDEHGQKIADAASAKGMTPKALCDENVAAFKDLNQRLALSNDRYIRTTDPDHELIAQKVFQKAMDAGDIYLTDYVGWYSTREEKYIKDSDAERDGYKDPVSGKPYIKHSEPAYFFKMSKYHQWLLDHIKTNPEFVQPAAKRNDLLQRLQDPLEDLCVSRSTFDWGIPLPNIKGHVMYVWFDALTNYLSGVNWPDGKNAKFWPADCHIIGKDITWFHCVIWPTMLKSAGIPLPKQVFSHGFVNASDGKKMSKSIGNVICPIKMLEKYNCDALRFHLLFSCTYGKDSRFSEETLVTDHDALLSDSFGNSFRRAQSLCHQMCGGVVPDCASEVEKLRTFGLDVEKNFRKIDSYWRRFMVKEALEESLRICSAVDEYLQMRAPWKMKNKEERLPVIKTALEAVYFCAHILEPALPIACGKALSQFQCGRSNIRELRSNLNNLKAGTPIKAPVKGDVLFVKLATQVAEKKTKPAKKPNKQQVEPPITRFLFKCGKVLSVREHPNADGCYVEDVDIGEEKPRQIVSKLRKAMKQDEIEGTNVVVIANLHPSVMRGEVSNGMVLVAKGLGSGEKMELLRPPVGAVPGDRCIPSGYENYPESTEIMDIKKKRRKQWKAVVCKLKTNDKCEACFDDNVFMVNGKGAVRTESFSNAHIS